MEPNYLKKLLQYILLLVKLAMKNRILLEVRHPVFRRSKSISNLVPCTKIVNFSGYYHQSDPFEITNKHSGIYIFQKHFN